MRQSGPSPVTNWRVETARYLPEIDRAVTLLNAAPGRPENIPSGPFDVSPTPLQAVIYRAVTLYEVGIWLRARETLYALKLLWQEGYLSPAAALARVIFELWGACHYQTLALQRFNSDRDLERLAKVVNRLFEGVRDEVRLPWGEPASERPIHVLDLVRALGAVEPRAEAMYNDLCEASHANQPRFFEWWLTGRLGDNWANEAVQRRGHELLERTVLTVQKATDGLVQEATTGLRSCRVLYGAA
jgi:hypothetical protein